MDSSFVILAKEPALFWGITSYQATDLVLKIILGVAATSIAWLVYKQSKKVSKADWEKCFSELHNEFWKDGDLREVRKWIVNDSAYEELRAVLVKRKEKGHDKGGVSMREYEKIDKLDKFLNYLCRIVHLVPVTQEQVKVWDNFFFGYWVRQCLNKRKELDWYVRKFYEPLLKGSLEVALSDMRTGKKISYQEDCEEGAHPK